MNKTNRQVAGGGGHPLRLRHRLRRNRLGAYRLRGLSGHLLRRVRVRGSRRNLLTVLCLLSILRLLVMLGLLSMLGTRLTVSRLLVLPVLVLPVLTLLTGLTGLTLPILTVLAVLSVLPVPTIWRITILVRSRHRFLPLAALQHRKRRPHPHHPPAEYDNNAEPTGQQSAGQHCPHN